jgi:hypothetical protein
MAVMKEFDISLQYYMNMPDEMQHITEITLDGVDRLEAEQKALNRYPNSKILTVTEKTG